MRLSLVLCLALAAVLPGCPGTLEDPERFAGQFGGGTSGSCPDIPVLFQTTCTGAGCHGATAPANMLDLASPDVFTRLSGKMAVGNPDLLLIDPMTPEDSVLYTKLTSPPPFGSPMPLTGGALDDTTVGCVLTWIQTSAKGLP